MICAKIGSGRAKPRLFGSGWNSKYLLRVWGCHFNLRIKFEAKNRLTGIFRKNTLCILLKISEQAIKCRTELSLFTYKMSRRDFWSSAVQLARFLSFVIETRDFRISLYQDWQWPFWPECQLLCLLIRIIKVAKNLLNPNSRWEGNCRIRLCKDRLDLPRSVHLKNKNRCSILRLIQKYYSSFEKSS